MSQPFEAVTSVRRAACSWDWDWAWADESIGEASKHVLSTRVARVGFSSMAGAGASG